MAFLELMCTASKLRKLKDTLVEEKTDAIKEFKKEKTRWKFRHTVIKVKRKIRRIIKKILTCYCLDKFCYKLRRDGSCENFVLKSIIGFITGFFLTYIFFIFLVFQLNFKLSTATILCSLIGIILTIGLAFSATVRCIVVLMMPQFFSQRGRQGLLAYAFILAISGPVRNTANNMGILSESLACGQEQLKSAARQIIDVIKKPFVAIKEAIKKVVKTVKEIIKKIKEILLTIKRVIMAIIKVIKAAFQFIGKIINICNKELGTPFERCTRVFENAILDCNAKLGPLFNWLCSITYLVKGVCYLVKVFDYICMLIDFISNSIIGVVIRKIKLFIRHVKTMFYVRIKFSHAFEFQTITSKTLSEVASDIIAEVKQRTRVLLEVFQFMTSAATSFFLFIIFRVMYYRYRFLTSESFDNKYITKDFRALDMRRAKLGKETILPLNKREAMLYVSVESNKLAKKEKQAMAKSLTTLATAAVKLAIIMATDYCLFWILNLINYYGRFQSKVPAPNVPTAHISGKGFLADLLRCVVKAFQPAGILLEIDTVPCLPIPIPPDYDRYVQIATIMLFCFFLTIAEPYGLRLRHIIMTYYNPTRAKQRAIWLYNHLMRTRNSFLKFARRQLKRKVFGDKGIEKITCKEYLAANLLICRYCLGGEGQTACLLCGEVFRESDDKKPIKCKTPGCPGVYCEQCYADLQNLCTVCLSPIEYGDLSDISEEKDSSGEEEKRGKKKDDQSTKQKTWCCRICKRFFAKRTEEKNEEDEGTEESDIDDHTPKPKKKSWFKRKTGTKIAEDKVNLLHDVDSEEEDQEKELQLVLFSDMLIKDKNSKKLKDSDYCSSGNSTDYSYSYQYDKSQYTQPTLNKQLFKDVEKQEIPDYASMESFREDTRHSITETLLSHPDTESATYIPATKTVGTTISGVTLEDFRKEKHIEFSCLPKKSKVSIRRRQRARKKEETPLLTDSDSDADRLMQDDQKQKFLLSKSTDHLDSPSSTSLDSDNKSVSYSSIDSEIRADFKYIKINIRHEDLSRPCPKYTESVFSHVTYDEISESPRSTTSSKALSSSTVISSLKDDSSDEPKSTKKSIKKIKSDAAPLDSASTYTFENNQRKKVKQYYKAVKDVPATTAREKRKPGKIMRFLHKFFPKRKKNLDVLPLYTTESKNNTELKSYKSPPSNWNTLSASGFSSTCFGPNNSTNTGNSITSEEQSRERGGECCPIQNSYCIVKADKTRDSITLSKQFATGLEGCFNCPSDRQTILVTKDFLSKYFVSIEDLTPTRDCDISMKAPESSGSFYRNKERPVREFPEKDAQEGTRGSRSVASHASVADDVQESSSSNLSESLCKDILGVPFPPIRIRRLTHPDNTLDTQADRRARQGRLSGISETGISDNESNTGATRQNIRKPPNSHESPRPQIQDIQEGVKDKSDIKNDTSAQPGRAGIQSEYNKRRICDHPESYCSLHKSLQTCPTPILKHRMFDDTKTMDSPRYSVSRDVAVGSGDRLCACGTDKYPVRESETTVEPRPKQFFTSDKMQQTSDNDTSCPTSRTCPTATDSSAISNRAVVSTESESTRARTVFIDTTDTEAQVSSTPYCNCRYAERGPNNCCSCPPPPPRYENYLNMQERNYRSTPKFSTKYICTDKYTDSSDYTQHSVRDNSTSTRRSRRDSPKDSGYSLRESQYNEFRRDPPDSFAESPRRCRPLDRDVPRHRNKSASIIICACKGDCRRCQRKHNPHPYRKHHSSDYETSSSEVSDEESDDEDYLTDSHPTCFELPYQHNEDYLELVQELEETLQSRNRNRVRRAMQEFEHRSKHNKPLDKPITNYDEASESEQPIIQKISQLTEKNRCCGGDKCTCRRVRSAKAKYRERQHSKSRGCPCGSKYRHRSPTESSKTHWQMDTASGEWFKVSGNMQMCQRGTETSSPHRGYCPYECNCCSAKKYEFR